MVEPVTQSIAPQIPSPPRDAFYAVAKSSALRSKPLSTSLFDVPIVVFRNGAGQAQVFVDRCPHRSVPLSAGRIRDGELECPYHGWRFGEGGRCTHIPGLIGEAADRKSRRADAYAVVESGGFVWARGLPSSERAHDKYDVPFPIPFFDDMRYSTIRHVKDFSGTVHAVAENALDVPHTAFLHAGLFRRESSRSTIDVTLRRGPGFVEAEYAGEPRPDGVLGRVLAPQGGEVEHFDRFFLPSIAQVEYRLGASHVIATTALTPTTKGTTRMFASVSFRLPFLPSARIGEAIGNVFKPLALTVLEQDARILKLQAETIERMGQTRFASTRIDVLGPEIIRLLARASRQDVAVDPGASPSDHTSFQMEV